MVLAHSSPDTIPPLTPESALTSWVFEPIPAIAVLVTLILYLMGIRALSQRGVRWPAGRTFSFIVLGLGSIVITTQSFLAAYDTTLFWVHMVQHMILTMVAPIFLALGAPVTLALRTLPPKGKSALMSVIHSRYAKAITFPLVAAGLFILNPWLLYFTGFYELTLRNEWVHNLNHVHFLAVGCLWFWVLLGLDPLPGRPSHPMRLIAVFLTLPFHAFLGVAIMSTNTIIAQDWYSDLGRTWGPTLAEDQRMGGSLLWAWGDVMAVLMMAVLFAQWAKAADREAARVDRQLDREEALAARRAAAPPAASEDAGSDAAREVVHPQAATADNLGDDVQNPSK